MKLHHHRLFATAPLVLAAAIAAGVAAMPAMQQQDPNPGVQAAPMPSAPSDHHQWLEQLVGTWTVESEMIIGEGQPPVKSTGSDTVRSIGGRWIVGDLKSEMPGMGAISAVLTLGYNPETGKYQATWIDSLTDHLWVYGGTLDPTKKILTLEAEGPNMMDPTAGNTRFRDVIEFKSADHRTLASSAFVDGKWVQFGTANYRRTK